MKFLLDTNFLLIPGKLKVDVFSELQRFGKPELFTLDLVVRELRELSSGPGRDSSHARLALDLLGRKHVKILESAGDGTDPEIERIASEDGFAVCTQDRELQKKLKKRKIPVIFLRQNRVLARL